MSTTARESYDPDGRLPFRRRRPVDRDLGDLSYTESLIDLAHAADVLVIDSGAAIVRQGQAVSAGQPSGPGARRVPAGAAVSIRTARSRMWSPWPASPCKTSRAHAHRSGRGRRGGNDCSHQKNVFGRGHRRLRPAGDSGQRPAAAVGQRRRAVRDGVLDPSRFRGHDNRSRQDHRLGARVCPRGRPPGRRRRELGHGLAFAPGGHRLRCPSERRRSVGGPGHLFSRQRPRRDLSASQWRGRLWGFRGD